MVDLQEDHPSSRTPRQISDTSERNDEDVVLAPPQPLQPQESVVSRVYQFIYHILTHPMNAAVTFFGLGVGVGLILGDSSYRDEGRSEASNDDQQEQQQRWNRRQPRSDADRLSIEQVPVFPTSAALLPSQ